MFPSAILCFHSLTDIIRLLTKEYLASIPCSCSELVCTLHAHACKRITPKGSLLIRAHGILVWNSAKQPTSPDQSDNYYQRAKDKRTEWTTLYILQWKLPIKVWEQNFCPYFRGCPPVVKLLFYSHNYINGMHGLYAPYYS